MRWFQVLAGGASLGAATAATTFQEIVAHVNARKPGWTAEVPSRFADMEDARRLCGTILRGHESFQEMEDLKTLDEVWTQEIPDEFDVREQWPHCANVSGHIRDQSDCGSCWAFASTEALNDRRCIATGDTTLLSVEDTVSNCGLLQCGSMGCEGGQPGGAWRWFRSTGVVTGGDFDDIGRGDTCAPYTLQPCAHHTAPTSKYPKCPSSEYPTPRIGHTCSEKGYGRSYASDKKRASRSYGLNSPAKIQKDMLQYGSVTAAFSVYEDFVTYKSGVYKHTTGGQLGGHAVKIIGWGAEDGQDYWLIANSWNEMWGNKGTFRIARGRDECGIESQVVSGTVDSDIETFIV